ncbi:MAG: carboxypeptidase regulatory-like domain-containing protein [Bacteroidales bacterium]|nr:carboxypeptidase regulatory-like domain-containing protein [Bacteroidales bacterium]
MKKLLTFFVAMIASISLMAQVTTSSISGKITDNNKSTLPGATVVATHTPSGSQYYAVADANGTYRLLNIRPGGPYTIEVRMVGFQTVKQEGITTTLGETKILNIRLNEEAIGLGEVTVAAEAISNGMDSDRAGATTAIDNEQITALPTLSRSLNDVLAITPQASVLGGNLSIGGGNYRSSYVTVDGAAFNNAFGIGGNLPAGGSPISLDALEAMTISITPFDVRHSGFTGGAINAVTKSGTNNWHVSVYDYFTNDGLIGTKYGVKDELGNYPDRLKLSSSLDNTVGISVGGPIVKDKLFFFVNFEYQSDIDPGQTHFARETEDDEWGSGTQYNRPTVEKMEEISDYLQKTYGYNPGRYQNYSASTPDYKLLARLDWNVSDKDKFNIRYSLVKNKYSTSPSSSINPLSSSVYNRNSYGRTSDCALYFESSRYFQEQNFSSVAAEWNHSFLSGRANNMLRATYSRQHEPRSFVGDLFPTVDILEPLEDGTPAVYTSFGPDPFTYGNLRDVQTAVVTDELSYLTGIHNFTFGAQYEFDNTKNGFMQGGAGYYVYNSWDDFVNNANPRAFAITYGNNEKHEQVYPYFNYMQGSLYAQDEMTLSERFKLALGLRVELPYYPSISEYNYNKEFAEGWDETFDQHENENEGETIHHAIADGEGNTMYGMSTADMPKARVNFSPRLGFNWDLTGERKYIIRGGSGLYTGRLPFVWIVSTVGNSNCLQNQYINSNGEEQIKFFTSPSEIIANNSDLLLTGDLPAPQSTTIMDKNLKMMQTWKSSLAFDAELPGGIKATLEGIYNKDITSVAVTKLGLVEDGTIQLPGEPGERLKWRSEGVINSLGRDVTPYLITNTDKNGYYYSVTGQLSKDFKCGLNLMAAYTYAEGKNVTDGIGDQITSAYNTNAFGINGSNVHELGYSSYVSPHRLILNLGWHWATGQHTTELIGLYYEGVNLAYIGSYSYTRYSYTMTSNVNGDGGSNSLAYIPTEEQLFAENTPYTNPEEFNDFIKADKYLSTHRGMYAERGGAIAPWRHTFNFKYERTYKFHGGESISAGIDVMNLANLFYRGWGNMQRLSSSDIVKLNGRGTEEEPYSYTFTNPTWNTYASTYSTWSAALNLRFNF